MNRRFRVTIILSVVLIISVLISGCSPRKDNRDQIKNERFKFPAFDLKDLNGNQISSDIFMDYDITIVNIWQSTCGACIGELEALNVIYSQYKDKGVNVLGISVDNVEETGEEGVKNLAESLGLEFTNLIADEDYMKLLVDHVQLTPTSFIIGQESQLLTEAKIGSNGKEKDIEDIRDIIESIR